MVKFYRIGEIEDKKLEYAALVTAHKGKHIFVRHKNRKTWEIPGGRREKNETIEMTGIRELYEETGAEQFNINELCEYSITIGDKTTYGKLFSSNINKFGKLPNLEIGEVKLFNNIPRNLTYPHIQPLLILYSYNKKAKVGT